MNGWLQLAHKLSFDSCHPKHKMAAVLVRGGNVLALAANHHDWGKHAELRALSQMRDVRGSTVYVMRHNKKTSKPCPMCRTVLISRGVKKAVFINSDGHVEIEKLN